MYRRMVIEMFQRKRVEHVFLRFLLNFVVKLLKLSPDYDRLNEAIEMVQLIAGNLKIDE
jgi:hypothetical protein